MCFSAPKESREPRNKRFDKKSEESKPSSGKISLFDFLEDKLPIQSESVETSNLTQNSHTYNIENNHDRVEPRSYEAQSGRGGRYSSLLGCYANIRITSGKQVHMCLFLIGVRKEDVGIRFLQDIQKKIKPIKNQILITLLSPNILSITEAIVLNKTSHQGFNEIKILIITPNMIVELKCIKSHK